MINLPINPKRRGKAKPASCSLGYLDAGPRRLADLENRRTGAPGLNLNHNLGLNLKGTLRWTELQQFYEEIFDLFHKEFFYMFRTLVNKLLSFQDFKTLTDIAGANQAQKNLKLSSLELGRAYIF